jgi:hypothetical protein
MQAWPRGARITSSSNRDAWGNAIYNHFYPWERAVEPDITGALIDGVAITAQYLILWIQAAQPTLPSNDPRRFTQIYAGAKGAYWAVDNDGHMFRRLGWSVGWLLIKPPSDSPVISLWPDAEGGVHVVDARGIWYLTPEEKWNRVYPPQLVGPEQLTLHIKQLVVVAPIILWALDTRGAAYQGEGLLPQVEWSDTSSPTLTSLGATSRDSAWGANAADRSVWEYAGGRWQNRGSGVVQFSVDTTGKPWGISTDGKIVTYDGSSWQTPPGLSDAENQLQAPGWGPLAWINARGTLLIVDRQGVAWGRAPLQEQSETLWMPLG